MKNIDAILMEKMGNDVFVKEQLEKNFSNEKLESFLQAHIQVRCERIINIKIAATLGDKLSGFIEDVFRRYVAKLNMAEMIASAASDIFDKVNLDYLIDQIVEDELYDHVKYTLQEYFKKALAEKLGTDQIP